MCAFCDAFRAQLSTVVPAEQLEDVVVLCHRATSFVPRSVDPLERSCQEPQACMELGVAACFVVVRQQLAK